MRSLSYKWHLLSLFAILIMLTKTAILTIDSTSLFVGDNCNYTITLTNQTSIASLTFNFNNWTNASTDPYSTSTRLVYSSTTVAPVSFPGVLKFTPSTAWTGTNFSFVLTFIRNPSSTKPYTISLTVDNGTASNSFSANLTRINISNNTFATLNYSTTVGSTSSNSEFYITPSYSLMQNSSFMRISYDSSIIALSPSGSSSYTLISNTSGTVTLGSFRTQSYNLLQVVGLAITNPQAAVTFTITCLFYLNQSGTIYNIEAFYRTITLTVAPFTSLSSTSTLTYGVLSSITVLSSLPFVPKNNASILAYTVVTYSSNQFTFQSTSNCAALSSTTCKLILNSSSTITDLLAGIGSFTTTSLTFTVYTYFNGAFYPLCQSNLALSYLLQSFSAISNTALCSNVAVGGQNNISLSFSLSSVAAGDLIYLSSFKGLPLSSWTATTINSATWYYYTLKSTNLATINSITSNVILYLPYSNSNYTVSTPTIANLNIYRGSVLYSASSTSPSLCSVTTPLKIVTSSLIPTLLTTYSPINLELDVSLQFFDYNSGDYLVTRFRSSSFGENYLLAGAYLGLSYSVMVNGVVASISSLNDTALKIVLKSGMLPTIGSPVLKIIFSNLANPPMKDLIWVQLITYEGTTNGLKQNLVTSNFTTAESALSYSVSNLQLLANNSLVLLVTNLYRNITNKNSSLTSSSLTITIPSKLNCTAVSSSVTVNWNTAVQTSSPIAIGNTTQLSINLGTCYVSYFTGTVSYAISEKYGNIASTSTTISVSNICGDGCYQCSSNICTKCFDISYSNATLLYGGVCYEFCPSGSYKSSEGVCTICHASCGSCNGGSYSNCTSCSTSFQLSSSYCESVCGPTKYLSGTCQNCHVNCQSCLSDAFCYVCKTNATLINSACEFTSCFSPCLTCLGNQSTCASCIDASSLYQSACYAECPSGTYKTTTNGQNICQFVSEPVLYVPLTIVGLVLMLVIFGLRAYASKKIGNQSKRSRNYKNDQPQKVNYKLNCWRMGSIVYAYLQLIAAIIIIIKNSSYKLPVSSTMIAAIGLILHLVANMVFLIGFCVIVKKKRVQNGQQQEIEQTEQQKNLSIRYRIVVAFSCFFTYRTYKILYANLFIEKNMSNELRMTQKAAYPNQGTFNEINLSVTQQLPNKKELSATKSNNKKLIKATNFESSKKDKSPRSKINETKQSPNSKKPFIYNTQNQETNQQPHLKVTQTLALQSPQIGGLYYNKRFNHPFLTYLTLTNLLTATIVIIIGAIFQIMFQTFPNMLWWGIDCLVVSGLSLVLTSWDLWNFANLKKQQQHSQMSSIKNEANQTHQNLKQAEAEVQVELAIKNQKKYSPKKLSSLVKPSFSNRSTQKAKQNDENQQLPVLKVFEDFEEKDNTVLKQAKTKKFSTKNMRYGSKALSKRQASIANTRKNLHGELCDDIYINFPSQQIEKEVSTTTHFRSRRSASPRSLKEQPNKPAKEIIRLDNKQQKRDLDYDQEELDEQPPNFANISDIEEIKIQANNLTISSGLIHEEIQ